MSHIVRVIYGVNATDNAYCKAAITRFSKIDSILSSNHNFSYICVSNIESINKSHLLGKVRESKARYIIFNSIYNYSTAPESSNNWPLYIYQPILFESSKAQDHSPTILPTNRIKQNILSPLYHANLLSVCINVSFIEDLSDKLYDKNSDTFNLYQFLVNSDMGLWSNLESEASREISMTPIDLGYDTSMLSTTNLVRKDRCPLKVRSLVSKSYQNLSLSIYQIIPSVRFILTSEQTNIYTTPFSADLLYIRIATSIPNKLLEKISPYLTSFGIKMSSFSLLNKLISCLQANY